MDELKGLLVKRIGRYDTSQLIENQYEPGSRGLVLKNLLGIQRKRDTVGLDGSEEIRGNPDEFYGR